jgi:WD40 repeat protein
MQGKITSFGDHTGNITATGFHAECRWMFTGSEDGHLKIWDTRYVGNTVEIDWSQPIIYIWNIEGPL